MSVRLSASKIHLTGRLTNCPLCSSPRLKPEFSISIFDTMLSWDSCLACDLVFQNPRLDDETIQLIYKSEDYWNTAYSNYEEQEETRVEESRVRLKKIMSVTGLQPGKLLDVGCATGFFAAAAKEKGFLVKGIDPSPELAEFGRKRHGIEIECDILEGVRLEDEFYDLITLWGTDSHFLNPLEGFQKLVRSLKPGGIFCMTYQNFRHWVRIFFPGIKKSWNALYNLSPKSLQVLFDKVGLEIILHELEWRKTTLGHIGRMAKMPSFLGFQNQIISVPALSFPLVIARKKR